MVTVKNISDYINTFAPYDTKCEWDNCGMLIGDPLAQVKKIGFALDLTAETLKEAIEQKADLIITHHPVIFKAKKSFLSGDVCFEAAKCGISIISVHTCFDCAEGGVNDVLASILELENVESIDSVESVKPCVRIGNIKETDAKSFAKFIAESLGTTVRLINAEKTVKRVAVCGGAGMMFASDAIRENADAYVTGDIDHHEMLDAKESGLTVIAAGHFETEYPAMTVFKNIISKKFPETECVVLKQTNPVEFICAN